MKPTDEPIVISADFAQSVDELWDTITDPEKMRGWFFMEMKDFEPRVGFETAFTIVHDEREYTHQWKIVEVEEKQRIVYDWSYDGLPGRGAVVFELEPNDVGTKLTLTNYVLEAFPEDDPAFQRESAVQGWEFLINESLVEFLEDSAE